MHWDMRQIIGNACDTTFRRGWRAWFALVVTCFLFAFIGAAHSSQASFVDIFDRFIGTSDVLQPHNTEILMSYIDSIPWLRDLPVEEADRYKNLFNRMTESNTWVVRLLALNPRYFAENPDEVVANVVIVAIISVILRFCVQNVLVIGENRYVMETRYRRWVPWRRMFAPFHLHTLANVVLVMLCYHMTLLFWWLTVVGGVYKKYQYGMVPYLLAENPQITWREAKRLSMRMTDGYKWKIFVARMCLLPLAMLSAIPIVGILVYVPLLKELEAEIYFTLRENPAAASDLFVERAFDAPPYVRLLPEYQRKADEAPGEFELADLELETPDVTAGVLPYPLIVLIYIFFVFCIAGWIWEVGLHFIQEHEFVNRGTLYGPWIPIYGVGGIGIIVLLDRFKESPERLFCVTMALCAVLEYATSFILDFMFNSSYWDYNDMMFNVHGRICLAGLLAFGFGGLLGVYVVAPAIARSVEKMPVRLRNAVAMVLVAAFCGDLAYCVVNGFNSGSGVGEEL